jgi:hypothetical protein
MNVEEFNVEVRPITNNLMESAPSPASELPATASAAALVRSNSLIWTIAREELKSFFDAVPLAGISVTKGLLNQVAKRIRNMNDKLETAEQRPTIQNFWISRPQ